MNRRSFLTHTGSALGGLALTSGCSSTLSPRGESQRSLTRDLVGYWPLRGDAQDQSCHGNHGNVHATWPEGHVVRLDPNNQWTDCGRLGDALEINGLVVYNGKLYGGSIPRSEVFRYDDGRLWTSAGRFLEPADYQFKDPIEWARVTSLTVYGGKLFASMGSCTSSHLDAAADFRGRVYSMRAGQCVSHDRDIGPGWKHLTAVRRGEWLELFVDGVKTASRLCHTSTASISPPANPSSLVTAERIISGARFTTCACIGTH